MAKKKAWDKPIDWNNSALDWGVGDETTENLPLDGSVVQKYIKDNFGKRAGYFYTDLESSQCYVFSTEADYDKWSADTSDGHADTADLVLGYFEVPSKYAASIKPLDNTEKQYVFTGELDNKIRFEWSLVQTSTGSPIPTGEAVNCTYVIRYANDIRPAVTKSMPLSATNTDVTIQLDDFLYEDGVAINASLTITVTITGQVHKVSAIYPFSFNVINLSLSDSADISVVQDLDEKTTLDIVYNIAGNGTAYTEWYVDGKLDSTVSEGSLQPAGMTKTRMINLEDAAVGVHTIQYRAYIVAGDGSTRFYSDMLYRDFMFTRSDIAPFMSAIKTTIPKDKVKITGTDVDKNPVLYDLTQYTPYTLYYAVYSPDTRTDIPIKIYLSDETGTADLIAERSISAEEEDSVTFTPPFTGKGRIRIQSDNYVRDIDVDTAQNTMGIGEIGEDNGLIFAFAANGRTNNSSNRSDWQYKIPGTKTTCIADFQNFDWSAVSGWSNNRLNINNGASVDFKNFIPFSDDSAIMNAGRTIEFEFNTMNVNDDTAVLCEMRRNGTDGEPTGVGITVTASEASLVTAAGQKVSVKYKSGENIRLTFVIKPAADTGRRVILLFVNGVMSGAINYTADDSFVTPSTIKFTGKQTAEISLKQIRVYNRALQNDEVLNNYILYRDTTAEMLNLFNHNNISENNAISIAKLAATIPVMVVTGYLNVLDKKDTSKKAVIIVPKIKYYDYVNCGSENKETCFVYLNGGMGPQGTSSMTYPKRNYRLYGEFSKMQKPTQTPDNITGTWNADGCEFYKMSKDNISEDSSAFWTKLKPKGKAPKKPGDKDKRKYYFSFRNKGEWENGEPQAVPRWTIKADFAESSSTHNTGIARLWNNVLYNARVTYTPSIGSEYYWVCGVKDGVTDTKSLVEYNADGSLTDEIVNGYDSFVYVPVDYTVISGYMADDDIDIWGESTDPSSTTPDKPVKSYEDGAYVWKGLAVVKQNATQSANNETVLRTKAQSMAEANGYGYDVRTTVDGFPIVMFYQKDEKSDLIFMGKYNFNNDKSNEAVFGFCDVDWENSFNYDDSVDVPEEKQWSFDKSVIDVDPVKYSAALGGAVTADEARKLRYKDTVQCWELIDSGNDIALYKNTDGWDYYDADIETFGWARGFEARYPDDQPEDLTSDGYEIDKDTGAKFRPDAFLRWEKFVLPFAKWMCGIRKECEIEREIKGDNIPDVVTYAVYDEVTKTQLAGNSAHVEELTLTPKNTDGTVSDKPTLYTDSTGDSPITAELIMEFRELSAAGRISEFKKTLYHKDRLTGRWEPSPYVYYDAAEEGYKWEVKDQDGNLIDSTTCRYFAQSEANVYNKIISWKNPARFAAEKWEHFDMYKIAAYYIYLIRFAAVDQTVKNAMFTSEDGQHWYYINYDNDTILGVRNDGLLKYGPEITRNSFDNEINDFCYAARESTLWNCLEADEEFMKSIVPAVDSALNNAGLTYSGVLNMFENLQSDQWPEKVYNIDAEYKYIDSYLTDNENYLGSLQGSRKTHRRWWLSHRFDYYDALFMNESYKKQAITFLAPAVQIGTKFYITSGNDAYFAYGTNNRVQESGIHLYANGSVDADGNVRPESQTRHGFELYMTLQVGSPVAVYNPWNIEELDLRNLVSQNAEGTSYALTRLNIGGAWNADLGSKMRRLYLGDHTKTGIKNTGLQGTNYSGLGSLISLEELDITGFTGLKDLGADLDKLTYLKKFWAAESGLTAIRFADGAPLTEIILPDSVATVNFTGLTKLELSGLRLGEDGAGKNVTSMTIKNCPALQSSWQFFHKWHDARVANDVPNSECTLNVSNISWDDVDPDDLIEFGAGMKLLTLTGFIQLSSVPNAKQISELQDIYGKNVFDLSSYGRGLYITANTPTVVLSGPEEMLDGTSAEYKAVTFIPVAEMGREFVIQYSMSPANIDKNDSNIFVATAREGLTFNRSTHILSAVESDDTVDCAVKITATMRSVNDDEGAEPISRQSNLNVNVKKKLYPSESDLIVAGPSSISGGTVRFTWRCTNLNVNGEFNAEFVMSDEFVGKVDVTPIKSTDKFSGGVTVMQIDGAMGGETYINGYGGFKFTKKYNGSELCVKTVDTVMMDPNILLTQDTNPEVFAILSEVIQKARQNDPTVFIDWDDSRTYITLSDAEEFTASMIGTKFMNSDIKTFNEFAKFTNVTEIVDNMFSGCGKLEQIEIPSGVTAIGRYAFSSGDIMLGHSAPVFTDFYIKDSVTVIKDNAFNSCQSLSNVTFGRYPSLETISANAFSSCQSLEKIDIPNTVKTLGYGVFWFSGIRTLRIPASVTSIGYGLCAYCSSLESITVDPDNTEFYGSESVVDGKQIGGRNFILAAKDTYENVSRGWDKNGAICCCASTILPSITESICYYSMVSIGNTPADGNYDGLHSQNWGGVADLRSLTSLKIIRANSIMNLSNLTGFIFPSSLRTIESTAVSESSAIKSITFENGVETIGDYAFVSESAYDGGASISDIYLPASVKSIGIAAFGSKANTVKVDPANTVFNSRIAGNEVNFIYKMDSGVMTIILCGAAAKDSDLFNAGVIGIGSMCSYAEISADGSRTARDLVIDDTHFQNLTEIQDSGFLRANIGSIKIAKAVKFTGRQQFRRSTVTDADLSQSGITAIPSSFMAGCNDLRSVKLPTSLITIGDTAFSMTTGGRVFAECNLDECVNLETIGDYAFESNMFDTVDLSNLLSLQIIGINAFGYNENWGGGMPTIKTISLPPSVAVAYNAFRCNFDLKTIMWPVTAPVIGQRNNGKWFPFGQGTSTAGYNSKSAGGNMLYVKSGADPAAWSSTGLGDNLLNTEYGGFTISATLS